jgi:hypothetical protein
LRSPHAFSGGPWKASGSTRDDGLSLSLETQFGLVGHGLSLPSTNCSFGGFEAHDKMVKSTPEITNKTISIEIILFVTFFSFPTNDVSERGKRKCATLFKIRVKY